MSKIQIEKIGNSIAIRVRLKDGSYTPNTFYPIVNIRAVQPDYKLNFNPVQSDNNRQKYYEYTD